MAAKIIGGGLKLLGIGKKKKAADPVAATDKKGPIVTQLAPGTMPLNQRRKLTQAAVGTALSDKLGSIGKLGA